MYYNINENLLLRKLPKNLLRNNGYLFIDFDKSDVNTLADYGFYTLRNDNNIPPTSNNVENETQRNIVLDKPYFDIVRHWSETPLISAQHQPPQIPENKNVL
jgi:hypothetical protein